MFGFVLVTLSLFEIWNLKYQFSFNVIDMVFNTSSIEIKLPVIIAASLSLSGKVIIFSIFCSLSGIYSGIDSYTGISTYDLSYCS